MDLSTIVMDKGAALQAFRDYRDSVRQRHSAEDEQIMRGYRALARGQQLIQLRVVITAGGVHDDGLPKLAVAQSDTEWVYVRRDVDGACTFAPENRWRLHANRKRGIRRFPTGTLPHCGWDYGRHGGTQRAMVPIVPPALRPAHALANYWTLFEVDEWKQAPRPPGDPALLKHVGGDLYAVVAIWDLTPLEQAVLAGRNAER